MLKLKKITYSAAKFLRNKIKEFAKDSCYVVSSSELDELTMEINCSEAEKRKFSALPKFMTWLLTDTDLDYENKENTDVNIKCKQKILNL